MNLVLGAWCLGTNPFQAPVTPNILHSQFFILNSSFFILSLLDLAEAMVSLINHKDALANGH